jgi:hypothetical protein
MSSLSTGSLPIRGDTKKRRSENNVKFFDRGKTEKIASEMKPKERDEAGARAEI